MTATTLVPLRDYLVSTYHPDKEFVDGELQERNVGTLDHSHLQARLMFLLRDTSHELHIYPELRIQVAASRFRIPDLLATLGSKPTEQIPTSPPYLVIEILSPDDSMSSMQEKLDDYVAFGIENIWIFDPSRKKAFVVDANGVHPVSGEVLTLDRWIRIDLDEVWS